MNKTLFSWVGKNDLDAAASGGTKGLGAICQALTARQYDAAVLISDWPTGKTAEYKEWLERCTNTAIILKPVTLSNPTGIRGVYDHSKREIQTYLANFQASPELTFLLSSGTWAMAAVWIILANSFFVAKLVKSSPEEGLQDVEFPFDLAADYLPDLIKRRDEEIGLLFDVGVSDSPEFSDIIHRSQTMKRLIAKAQKVAPHFLPVLIQGESGTGKELLAAAIHRASLRTGKFAAVNCGAIPSQLVESELFGHKRGSFTGAVTDKHGLIKTAENGTLFLDEVGELPLVAQVKLLRFLQEGEYTPVGGTVIERTNVRIIAATNRNLIEEVAQGRFREDLFHRLAVAILNVPPVRERDGDINALVDHFLSLANRKLTKGGGYLRKTLSAGARTVLLQHSWPGNVRELQNTLIRAALWSCGNTLEKEDIIEALLPAPSKSEGERILGRPLSGGVVLEEILSDVARHYLERAVMEAGGSKSKAARLLGFKNYQTLDNWLKKYSLSNNQ
ncbi:hypothetical protein RW64_17175 [Geobacter sulfurreducens]|nr:hypothetical protein RW64_17175 [Geobacter sulfurreducens]